MDLFGEGKYHLIPSFFRTLIYLKKAKREFAIVFRTFGQDLQNVIFEFNKFCNGEHPCYSGRGGTPQVKFDGGKNAKDLRIKGKNQQALYYRLGDALNQSHLVTGSLRRVSLACKFLILSSHPNQRCMKTSIQERLKRGLLT